MKQIIRGYIFLAAIAGIVIVFDQATKTIVRATIPLGGSWMPWDWLAPYARIVHWYNTGVAFGMFQGQGLIFTILSFAVVLAIIFYFPRVPVDDWTLRLAMGLQMGGATGNLIDRITIGHVTDFISVGSFPVLNIADACISVGVGVLLLGLWLAERKQKNLNNGNLEAGKHLPGDDPEGVH